MPWSVRKTGGWGTLASPGWIRGQGVRVLMPLLQNVAIKLGPPSVPGRARKRPLRADRPADLGQTPGGQAFSWKAQVFSWKARRGRPILIRATIRTDQVLQDAGRPQVAPSLPARMPLAKSPETGKRFGLRTVAGRVWRPALPLFPGGDFLR